MKNWMVTVVAVASLAFSTTGLAHEGHTHKALGTITSLQADKVEIKKTDGKALTVLLDKKTTVTRGKEKLDATALKVGERVSVEYMESNKVMTAHAFKLGTGPVARK
jgi:hypothetical protein